MSRASNQLGVYSDSVSLLDSPEALGRSDWPSVRIARTVCLADDLGCRDWNDYLNVLGRVNYGKGNAYALGSIAMTYVSATELGKMLEKKFPKVYQDRSKTKQLLNRFQRDYNQFVRHKSQQTVDNEIDSLMFDKIGLEIDVDETDPRIWGVAELAVSSQIGIFGSKKLGKKMGLYVNEEFIEDEMVNTIEFLEHSNLDTKFIDDERLPHISLFESYQPVVHSGLKGSREKPTTITMDSPMAITS